MLASITPLGERGRHSRWGLTVFAFAVGATAAGAMLGAAAGVLGVLVLPAGLGTRVRLAVLAAALLIAGALDAGPLGVPGPRRQVDERWLDEYRGWVYGAGFGAQLGLGLSTVVASAGTYAMLVAALLSGSLPAGGLVVGCFGAVRGLTPVMTVHIRTPQALVALHRRLADARRPARLAVAGVLLAGAVLAGAGSLA